VLGISLRVNEIYDMNIGLKVTNEEFCKRLFDLINAFSSDTKKITASEAGLLTQFLLLPEKYEHKRFSSEAKKRVGSLMNLTMFNINNKLCTLHEKGYLYRDSDEVLYPKKVLTTAVHTFLTTKRFNINIVLDVAS
jgi:hypothetical protein